MKPDKQEHCKEAWKITTIEKAECQQTKKLWSEVFSEDSEQFTDYYYEYKANENRGYLIEQPGELCAMLFLTPYSVMVRDILCPLHYIVGVATKPAYRHQGMMKSMLMKALYDMSREGEAFTFLMPADPAIYEPFQFTYIYAKRTLELNTTLLKESLLFRMTAAREEVHFLDSKSGAFHLSALTEEEIPELVPFANRWLEQHQDVYVKRSEGYYHLAKKELLVQGGDLILIKKETLLVGFFLFARETNGEISIQEAMILSEYERLPLLREKERQPIIMARILDVQKMLSYARSTKELQLLIRITDPVIATNNGVFEWLISMEDSQIIKKESDSKKKESGDTNLSSGDWIHCTIDRLTAFLFGYCTAEYCFTFNDINQKEKYLPELQQISCVKQVFLNEIV